MKQKETAQERYLDAAAEAFMEQYAGLLEDGIQQDMDGDQVPFPAELDTRCRKLIRTFHKLERKKRLLRGISAAVATLVVIFGTFGILFTQVEAFRVPVMNYCIEKGIRFWEFSKEAPYDIPESFNENNPLEHILPGDFLMTYHFGTWNDRILLANYENDGICSVEFTIYPSDSTIQIDTEGAQVTEFSLGGNYAVMAVEDTAVRLLWFDAGNDAYFTLITHNIVPDQVLCFAEDIVALLN